MMPRDHTDQEYRGRLDEIRSHILQMAGLVEEMIGQAVKALLERDVEAAKQVIKMDAQVNAFEVDIDELGVTILARWQPMASDLRFVTLTFKMVTDLERIGDLAVNISERAADLSEAQPKWRWDEIEEMSTVARDMVRNAINAFLSGDVEAARAVIEQDDKVDIIYGRAFESILGTMMADPHDVHLGVHALSIAKWLERIADHATNLAEQVVFMVKGKDIRHPGKLGA